MDIMLTRIIELIGNEHGSIVKLAKQLGVFRTAFLFLPGGFCVGSVSRDALRRFGLYRRPSSDGVKLIPSNLFASVASKHTQPAL